MQTSGRARPVYLCLVALATAAIVLALACGNDDSGNVTQQGSESALCSDLNSLDSATAQVANLSTASSLDDVSTALRNVASSASDVKSSLRELNSSNDGQVQRAIANLEQSLIAAVNSGSFSQGKSQISSAASQLQASLKDARARASCKS